MDDAQLAEECRHDPEARELKMAQHLERMTSFMSDTLIPTLREMSQEKLTQFVEFCTGYHYIPEINENDKGTKHGKSQVFGIVVELNQDERMDEDSLPVSHTCVKTLKLPWHIYGGDRDKFASKLDMAMDYSRGVMAMN
jgi:hypothetical protein